MDGQPSLKVPGDAHWMLSANGHAFFTIFLFALAYSSALGGQRLQRMDMLQDIVFTGLVAGLPIALIAGRFARDSACNANTETFDRGQPGGEEPGIFLKIG